jgi:hypothetical protein
MSPTVNIYNEINFNDADLALHNVGFAHVGNVDKSSDLSQVAVTLQCNTFDEHIFHC